MIDQYPGTASERHASAARPVQKPLPTYVAGYTEAMFRSAARHGYRAVLG